MKKKYYSLFFALFIVHTCLLAQVTTKHFIWKPAVGGGTSIVPKDKENVVLKKPEAYLDWSSVEGYIPWYEDVVVQPFQTLIDKGYFSSNRMQDLEKNANIRIISYFDESGITSYVEFWLPDNVTTALTDEELHVINQAYTGVKMDLSFAVGRNGYGMKIEEFHCSGFFEIPFEDLKY